MSEDQSATTTLSTKYCVGLEMDSVKLSRLTVHNHDTKSTYNSTVNTTPDRIDMFLLSRTQNSEYYPGSGGQPGSGILEFCVLMLKPGLLTGFIFYTFPAYIIPDTA